MTALGGEKLVLIMPAYNAARTVELVFARIPAEVGARIDRFVVVDDGSTDDTLAVLEGLAGRLPRFDVLRHERNQGYGAAEKTLLDHGLDLGADICILVHADGQYPPEMIPALVAPLESGGADMVQGSRMLGGGALAGGMPLYKYLANKGLTAIENLAFGLSLAEYHSGYMLYHRRALTAIAYRRFSDSFDFDLEMIVAARVLGLRLAEIAIPTRYADEVSHLNPVRYGLDVLRVVWRYRCGHYHRLLGAGK